MFKTFIIFCICEYASCISTKNTNNSSLSRWYSSLGAAIITWSNPTNLMNILHFEQVEWGCHVLYCSVSNDIFWEYWTNILSQNSIDESILSPICNELMSWCILNVHSTADLVSMWKGNYLQTTIFEPLKSVNILIYSSHNRYCSRSSKTDSSFCTNMNISDGPLDINNCYNKFGDTNYPWPFHNENIIPAISKSIKLKRGVFHFWSASWRTT